MSQPRARRLRIALLASLAIAAAPGQCDHAPPYEPCAGRSCGAPCTTCAPGDLHCVEPAVVQACDLLGRCVPAVQDLCAPAQGRCEGLACGAPCVIDAPCRLASPPCYVPSILGHCDQAGTCVPGDPPPPGFCLPPPPWSCEGKGCGDACGVCPPGTDPAFCPVPTFAATACDRAGECVTATPWLCYDPCAGLACGAACHTCPPDATDCGETAVVKACDAAGRCVPETPTLACPP